MEAGSTGQVVPIRDPEALAAAADALLADRVELLAMGRRGRELAETRLGEERMLAETAAVLFGEGL